MTSREDAHCWRHDLTSWRGVCLFAGPSRQPLPVVQLHWQVSQPEPAGWAWRGYWDEGEERCSTSSASDALGWFVTGARLYRQSCSASKSKKVTDSRG